MRVRLQKKKEEEKKKKKNKRGGGGGGGGGGQRLNRRKKREVARVISHQGDLIPGSTVVFSTEHCVTCPL